MALVRLAAVVAVTLTIGAASGGGTTSAVMRGGAALDTLEVSGLRSGPVCNAGAGKVGRAPSDSICPSRSVLMRGKDTCVFDGNEIPCTWWGFEFDYRNAVVGVPLVCVWVRSLPGTEGNYEGVRSSNATTDTIAIHFPADSGHLFHPGFDGIPPQLPPTLIPVHVTFDCSYQGRPVFAVALRLIFSSSLR